MKLPESVTSMLTIVIGVMIMVMFVAIIKSAFGIGTSNTIFHDMSHVSTDKCRDTGGMPVHGYKNSSFMFENCVYPPGARK